jgi:uncharacterized membrane protein
MTKTMGLFSTIKRNSKRALKGNWGRAVTLAMLVFGATLLLSILQQAALEMFVVNRGQDAALPPPGASLQQIAAYIAQAFPLAEWIIIGVFTALMMLIIMPVEMGAARWFYGLVRGQKQPVSEAFYYFESGRRYGRSVWYCVNVGLRGCLWSLLFFAVPGGLFGYSAWWLNRADVTRAQSAAATIGALIASMLLILAAVFYSVCVSRYILAIYLLGESDGVTVGQAIRNSVKYTRGYRFSLMLFGLSYIGWILLCCLFFPLLYVWPYYSAGIAMYALYIIEKKRHETPDATLEFAAPEPEHVSEPEPIPEPEAVPEVETVIEPEPLPEPEIKPELEYFSRPAEPDPLNEYFADEPPEPLDPEK